MGNLMEWGGSMRHPGSGARWNRVRDNISNILKMSKVEAFGNKFDHGVTGIPSVAVCDLKGEVVAKTNSIDELKKLVN